jgi:hypothetical protein
MELLKDTNICYIKDGLSKFFAIPIFEKGQRIVDILNIEVAEKILEYCKVSTILGKLTELDNEDCEQLVEWNEFDENSKLFYNYITDHWLHSSKTSLKTLFKSNGLTIKEWENEPIYMKRVLDEGYLKYQNDMDKYDKLPVDYLIIKIDVL